MKDAPHPHPHWMDCVETRRTGGDRRGSRGWGCGRGWGRGLSSGEGERYGGRAQGVGGWGNTRVGHMRSEGGVIGGGGGGAAQAVGAYLPGETA